MALTNYDFFKNTDIHIVNIDEPNTSEPSSSSDNTNSREKTVLSWFINKYEEEFLISAFGFEFYQDFKQYIGDSGLSSSAPDIYKKLVNGTSYELNGETYYFKGLVENNKISMIADYIYYNYMMDNVLQNSEFGTIAIDNKVGVKVPSTPKMNNAYNRFLTKLQGVKKRTGRTLDCGFYDIVGTRLENGIGIDYFLSSKSKVVSLRRFLHDNRDLYPTVIFTPIDGGIQNNFGI